MAAAIDHPNILPVYEADEADGVLFIAMRLVEGTDLAAAPPGRRHRATRGGRHPGPGRRARSTPPTPGASSTAT